MGGFFFITKHAEVKMVSGSIAHFIESSRLLIENAIGVPEVAAVLAGFGYDSARLAEGSRLWARAQELVQRQVREYGEQYQASADAEAAREAFESAYMKALKVARVAFSDDALAAGALKLYGPRRQNIAGLLEQAATFYANLRADPKLSAKLQRFGYTADRLATEAALLEALRGKLQAQAKETGEAQSATAERDAALAALDAWTGDLRAICKVAFYGQADEQQKLGLGSWNPARKKKDEPRSAVKS
jgi:hypothetical protein